MFSSGASTRIAVRAGSVGRHIISCNIYNGATLIDRRDILVRVQNPTGGGGAGDPSCGGNLDITLFWVQPPIPCPEGPFLNSPNGTNQYSRFLKTVIFNMNGKIVLQSTEQSINIAPLTKGIYIIKSQLENGRLITQKIMR